MAAKNQLGIRRVKEELETQPKIYPTKWCFLSTSEAGSLETQHGSKWRMDRTHVTGLSAMAT